MNQSPGIPNITRTQFEAMWNKNRGGGFWFGAAVVFLNMFCALMFVIAGAIVGSIFVHNWVIGMIVLGAPGCFLCGFCGIGKLLND